MYILLSQKRLNQCPNGSTFTFETPHGVKTDLVKKDGVIMYVGHPTVATYLTWTQGGGECNLHQCDANWTVTSGDLYVTDTDTSVIVGWLDELAEAVSGGEALERCVLDVVIDDALSANEDTPCDVHRALRRAVENYFRREFTDQEWDGLTKSYVEVSQWDMNIFREEYLVLDMALGYAQDNGWIN